MKKIFLPLLALCGMVTGLTLTSCGGGGGANEGPASIFAGKVYAFNAYGAGGISLAFDDIAYGSDIRVAVYGSEDGTIDPDGNYTQRIGEMDVTIQKYAVSEDGVVSCRIVPSGAGSQTIQEASILILLGFTQKGNADDVDINSCSFYFETDNVPTKPGTSGDGALFVTTFDAHPEEEAEPEVGEELDDLKKENPLKRDILIIRRP